MSQSQKQKKGPDPQSEPKASKPKDMKAKKEELDAKIDDIIDEIDEVLEDAALAMTYEQRGGE